ncbi:MAG TPA: hypothetical protein VGH94_06025 [Acidimicrobiales bacterium]|jgi:hypothetical protein
MGRASSAKKVARANRASRNPGNRRSLAWPATISAVVVVGIALILFTVSKPNPAQAAPQIGDHWHAAYGINYCGTFLPPLTDVTADTLGLHTHGDGLIHIHPFTSEVTGKDANLKNWGRTTGLQLTDTSIKAAGIDVKNGATCDGKPATVQVKVWDDLQDDTGHLLTKDFALFNPQDQNIITIAFLPPGTDIPKPPDSALAALAGPADLTGATTTAPPATTTTAAK